jgi:hypothetical protein
VTKKQTSIEKVKDLVLIRFLTREAPYNAGDELAVPSAVAARFVKVGVAEVVKLAG